MDINAVVPLQIAGRCALCHNARQGVKPEVADLTAKTLEGIAETEHAIRRAEAAIELAREQGRDPKGVERLLKTARDRLKNTGALWHSFRLSAFHQELSGIRAVAGEAYSAAQGAMPGK